MRLQHHRSKQSLASAGACRVGAILEVRDMPGTAIDAVLERLTMSGLPEAAAGQAPERQKRESES